MRRFVATPLVLLFLIPLAAEAQSASVVGRVVDATGAVVPGVKIRVANLDTNQSHEELTNGIGDYTVPYLNPGRYTLEAQGEGFRAYKHAEFALELDQTLRVDIRMEVGATTDSITVTDAPAALNTDSGARGDVTSNAELTEMPLNGRNFTDLAFLTGGVIPRGEGADGAFAINGARGQRRLPGGRHE